MSEPTRGNKGTGQAPDEAKGVTGADGAASTNGRQNGRPDFVDGTQAARTGAAASREQAAKKPVPRPTPQGGGFGPRPQPPANARNQPPTARPQTPNNVNAPNSPTNSGGASGGSAPGTQDSGPPAQWAPKGQRRPGTATQSWNRPAPTVQPAQPVPVWDPPATAQPKQSLRDRLGLRKRTQAKAEPDGKAARR